MKVEDLTKAISKPSALSEADSRDASFFDPWSDVISGIDGDYASEMDLLMIEALRAVRDHRAFSFAKGGGLAAEFALYVLSGHGLTEYGTSPRGGWPEPSLVHLWDDLIKKWEAYYLAAWGESAITKERET